MIRVLLLKRSPPSCARPCILLRVISYGSNQCGCNQRLRKNSTWPFKANEVNGLHCVATRNSCRASAHSTLRANTRALQHAQHRLRRRPGALHLRMLAIEFHAKKQRIIFQTAIQQSAVFICPQYLFAISKYVASNNYIFHHGA
jgi:hypothetical protein